MTEPIKIEIYPNGQILSKEEYPILANIYADYNMLSSITSATAYRSRVESEKMHFVDLTDFYLAVTIKPGELRDFLRELEKEIAFPYDEQNIQIACAKELQIASQVKKGVATHAHY